MKITLPEVECKLSKDNSIMDKAKGYIVKNHTPYGEILYKNGNKQVTLDLRFSNLVIAGQFIYKILLENKITPKDIKNNDEKFKAYENMKGLNPSIEDLKKYCNIRMYSKKYNFMDSQYKDKLAQNVTDADMEIIYQAIEEVGLPAIAEAILD